MRSTRFWNVASAVVLASFFGATASPADTIETLGSIGAIALPASGLVAAAVHKDGRERCSSPSPTARDGRRLRPEAPRRPQRPDGGSQSFPSGHSASAFAGAAFLERRYGWSYGAPAYAVATFVAYSRVESKRHWTSDVVAGGAIGIASNLVFTHKRARMAVQPAVVPRGAGLILEARW